VLFDVFYAPDSATFGRIVGSDADTLWPGVAALISIVFSMNLVLACLNMLPLPPLDGSGGVMLLMDASTANRYQQMIWQTPMLGMLGMLAAWRLIDFIFYPVFWMFVAVIYPGASYQ
jgi:Zn-dependent protease